MLKYKEAIEIIFGQYKSLIIDTSDEQVKLNYYYSFWDACTGILEVAILDDLLSVDEYETIANKTRELKKEMRDLIEEA